MRQTKRLRKPRDTRAPRCLRSAFLGLAFVVAMPFAGIAALALGAKHFAAAYPQAARAEERALFLAAPFIGLAYALALRSSTSWRHRWTR